MQQNTRPILVSHPDLHFRAWLMEAAGPGYQVLSARDWAGLRAAAARASVSAVAVVDPYGEDHPDRLSDECFALFADLPSLPVIAAFEVELSQGDDVRTLVRSGAAGVIRLGEESPASLRRLLAGVSRRSAQSFLDRVMPKGVPARTRSLLLLAAETAGAGGYAVDMAAARGVSERTILRQCQRAALPPPRRLMAWIRILYAADLLDRSDRTVASVAAACSYAHEGALRRAVKSFLGLSIRELREGGALATASRAFIAELRELRARRPRQGIAELV